METKLKIRLYGDPCLRKKSEPLDMVGPGERMLIAQMIEAMYEHKGIGLAAPQVGVNKRLFVADIGDGPFTVVNPVIRNKRGFDVMEEGCLCLPGIGIDVRRPSEISVSYIDENNHKIERDCSGLLARVMQHETDHLDGKVIIDYAGWLKKRKLAGALAAIRAQALNGTKKTARM